MLAPTPFSQRCLSTCWEHWARGDISTLVGQPAGRPCIRAANCRVPIVVSIPGQVTLAGQGGSRIMTGAVFPAANPSHRTRNSLHAAIRQSRHTHVATMQGGDGKPRAPVPEKHTAASSHRWQYDSGHVRCTRCCNWRAWIRWCSNRRTAGSPWSQVSMDVY